MELEEIKRAIKENKTVCWKQDNYEVQGYNLDIPENWNNLNIVCLQNNHCIGLTHMDNITLNGEQEDFYIKE